jgi:GNAT superfamily N-acetyltransferase
MGIGIVNILDRPDLVAVVVPWLFEEWGRSQGESIEQLTAFVNGHGAREGVGQFWVLLADGVAAAVATLEVDDLGSRPDLTPWLANVLVEPSYRGRGHAVRLVRHVEAAARAAGLMRFYLHSESAAGLYARLGWVEIGHALHHGHPVTIMARDLG